MSFFAKLQSLIVTTETDVVKVIAAVKAAEKVAEKDVAYALGWVAKQAPTVASDLVRATGIIEALGVSADPRVLAAIEAANIAVKALNVYAAAYKVGSTDQQSVVNGYIAIKQASASVSSAVAAAASSGK